MLKRNFCTPHIECHQTHFFSKYFCNMVFHEAVKNAFRNKAGQFHIDPLTIKVGGIGMEIVLGAEKLIAVKKGVKKIAVEIRSFIRPSIVSEFHAAIGQYYRKALGKTEIDRLLYLAVPQETYSSFFTLPFIAGSDHLRCGAIY